MANSLRVVIPFADHAVGDTIPAGQAADVLATRPGYVVAAADASAVALAAPSNTEAKA